MSDTDNGQIQTEGQPVAPMPSAEEPAEGTQEPTLPDGVKARTAEEFEKLKEHNRKLAEENRVLKGGNPSPTSVFDELRPNPVAAPMVPASMAGIQQPQVVDEGGYIDATLLNSTLSAAQKQALEAKQIALQTQNQIQRFRETETVRAVHSEFPEVDPNSDQFDPVFYEFVKNDMIGQMMKGQEDFRAAALKAKQTLRSAPTAQPRKDTISAREQASAPTGTARVASTTDNERQALVEGTRKGDKNAIFERLKASGY